MAKTYSDIKAAGGLNLKLYAFKCPSAAGSVTVTGIASTDVLQSCFGAKMSGALVKTVGNLTTACTLGTNKVILTAVKALTGAKIDILVHSPA